MHIRSEQLYEINKEDQENKKSIFDKKVDAVKLKLNQIYDFRKNSVLNKYKK